MTEFPNLFIIGAMKAGTSSLHEYLHQHPEIFMARFKEPQYFAPHSTRWGEKWGQGNPYPEPGSEWYLRLFADAGEVQYAGESSVSYTAVPWVTGCERRIFDFNPEARLIYIMRDPIERTLSHYWTFVADGREDRDMLTAVQRKEEYIARSDYARQLRPYFDVFGRHQVFTLTLEQLNAEPDVTFRRLFQWLGVNDSFRVQTETRFNVGPDRLRQTRRGLVPLDTWTKSWRWRRLEQWMPEYMPRTLAKMIHGPVTKSQVDPGPTIQYLRPILQKLIRNLVELLEREFPEWTTLYPVPSAQERPVAEAR